jgi:ankyrin repeat protein
MCPSSLFLHPLSVVIVTLQSLNGYPVRAWRTVPEAAFSVSTARDSHQKQTTDDTQGLVDAIETKDLAGTKANLAKVRSDPKVVNRFLNRIKNVGEYFYYRNLYPEALAWYTVAADEGCSTAQVNVGYMYLNGKGVVASDDEAVKWFRKAADQGDPWGAGNMGYMYQYGRGGLPQSSSEARRFYKLAARAGVSFAMQKLRELGPTEESPIESVVKKGDLDAVRKLEDVNEPNKEGATALLLAVRQGNSEMVKLLLARGANPDRQDKNGDFPLLSAVMLGRRGVVPGLLTARANLNLADMEGNTPLTQAFIKQQPEIVSMLLGAGTDVNKKGTQGGTALLWAIPKSNLPQCAENLRKVLDAGADLESREEHGFTALMLSLDSIDLLPTTTLLIQRGADVNARDSSGNTPLMVGAVGGNLAQLKLLLKHGARINDSNGQDLTAVMIAVEKRDREAVRELVKAGADFQAKDFAGHSALTRAVWAGDAGMLEVFRTATPAGRDFTDLVRREKQEHDVVESTSANDATRVRQFLDAGASAESRAPDGHPLLQIAAIRGESSLVKLLLDHRANANSHGPSGATALMLASARGDAEIVRLLISAGARLDDRDDEGRPALIYALTTRQPGIVSFLIEGGADVNASDKDGINALAVTCLTGEWGEVRQLLSAGGKETLSSCSLQAASALGTPAEIETLIKSGVDVNAQQKGTQVTALHIAASAGRTEVVAILLRAGADPDIPDAEGSTPLIRAVEAGKPDVVRALLQSKVNLNKIKGPRNFGGGGTALHSAINGSQDEIADILIAAGVDIDAVDARGETALMLAARRNDTSLVEKLIERDANVNLQDESLWTALMKAVVSGNFRAQMQGIEKVVKAGVTLEAINSGIKAGISPSTRDTRAQMDTIDKLVRAGSDLEATNNAGETPIVLAAREGNVEAFQLLIADGADLSGVKGSTSLSKASEKGSKEIVKLLLTKKVQLDRSDRRASFDIPGWAIMDAKDDDMALALIAAGADVHYKNENGRSPILIAALDGREAVVRALLKAGAKVDDVNEEGQTSLLWAAEFGHAEVVQLLVVAGADIQHRNKEGDTALLLAAGGENEPNSACMRILLAGGAKLTDVNSDGDTALHLAASRGYDKNTRFLLSQGESPNIRNRSGRTPIFSATLARDHHYAIPDEGDKVIRVLVEKRAEIDAPDNEGITALIEAATKGYVSMVRDLIRLGANVNARTKSGSTALLEVLNAHDEEPASLDPVPRLTPEAQVEVARELIKGHAEVNVGTEDGVTPLMRTAFSGQLELARLLIASHANVDAKNSEGWTALMFASAQGNLEIVKLLLRAHAKMEPKNNSGEDASSLATTNEHSEVAQLLGAARP